MGAPKFLRGPMTLGDIRGASNNREAYRETALENTVRDSDWREVVAS